MNKRVFVPFPLATVVQDYFGRANENPIKGPWLRHPSGGLNRRLDSNGAYAATGDGSGDTALAYIAGGKMRDQWAECRYATTTAVMDGGPCVRINMNASGASNYVMFTGYGSGNLYQSVGDALTQLGTNFGMTVVIGDTIRLEAIGNTIHVYQNGRYRGSRTVTDATAQRAIAVGYPGLFLYDEGLRLDRFRGGSLPYGPTPLPIRKAETRPGHIIRPRTRRVTLFTDNFNRPNVTGLHTESPALWEAMGSGIASFNITSNEVTMPVGNSGNRVTRVPPLRDQWARVRVKGLAEASGDVGCGVMLNSWGTSGAQNYYAFSVATNGIQLWQYLNGTNSNLIASACVWNNGDFLTVEHVGSTFFVYRNESLYRVFNIRTGVDAQPGRPGISYGSTASNVMDDFSCGAIVSDSPVVIRRPSDKIWNRT